MLSIPSLRLLGRIVCVMESSISEFQNDVRSSPIPVFSLLSSYHQIHLLCEISRSLLIKKSNPILPTLETKSTLLVIFQILYNRIREEIILEKSSTKCHDIEILESEQQQQQQTNIQQSSAEDINKINKILFTRHNNSKIINKNSEKKCSCFLWRSSTIDFLRSFSSSSSSGNNNNNKIHPSIISSRDKRLWKYLVFGKVGFVFSEDLSRFSGHSTFLEDYHLDFEFLYPKFIILSSSSDNNNNKEESIIARKSFILGHIKTVSENYEKEIWRPNDYSLNLCKLDILKSKILENFRVFKIKKNDDDDKKKKKKKEKKEKKNKQILFQKLPAVQRRNKLQLLLGKKKYKELFLLHHHIINNNNKKRKENEHI